MSDPKYHDALVVGTGFGGLYELHLLKQLGLDVIAIDSASDVGGTWHWNRYPGARSDVESITYRYSWDKELLKSSPWPHNYLTQPELEAYFQEVARKHDLYRHIQFNTTLQQAIWNDKDKTWNVKTSSGNAFTVRYLVTAIGILHRPQIPHISGLENFVGDVVHSASWRPEIEWEGKRIAVIGSGASGVQLVGTLAEHAKSLTHFVRHAQYVLPANLRAVSVEERKVINDHYDQTWNDVFASSVGFGFAEPNRPTLSVSPEDRERIFQDLWDQGSGFRFMFGGFSDLIVDEAANKEAIRFIHKKIDEIVKSPEKAKILKSSDWFARRPLTDDKYYSRFNDDSVTIVDLKQTPISSANAKGIVTSDDKLHEFDLIVFATGFDAADGTYYAIDFRGHNDLSLKDHWSRAPRTHLGATTSSFPNLFFVNGPGSVFANNLPVTETGATFAAHLIARSEQLRKEGKSEGIVESTKEADDQWFKQCQAIADVTLFAKTPSWFFGENVEGRTKAPRFYFGGIGRHRAAIAKEKEDGYPGFKFS